MKEELQGKLVEILTSIQTAASQASGFAMEQLPDIAQSYVTYGRAVSVFSILAGLALLALSFWAARMAWKESQKDWQKRHMGIEVCAPLVAIFGGLIGVIWTSMAVKSTALVWFAPKVWLLKEIASLLK